VIEFEWDLNKARLNLRKHGVAFKEAATVFRDPLSITFDDPDHSEEEERYIIIGLSDAGRLLMVSHTNRGNRIRVIHARELTRSEREAYEEEIGRRQNG